MAQTEAPLRIPAIEALAAIAAERRHPGLSYAGEVSPEEAFGYLQDYDDGVLVDVRTVPEWQFVGEADLSQAAGRQVKLSWKVYPTFETNPEFITRLKNEKISADMPLFFICRSGGRSLDAACAMTQQGFRYCFNVEGGFEGEPDNFGHRGTGSGWKAANLPWVQG